MSADFTVIFHERQHFGDTEGRFDREAPECHFMGQAGSLNFDTPGVEVNSPAILSFQSFGIDLRTNRLQLNGADLPDALSPSVELEWKTHSVIIPAGLLKPQSNEMHVESLTRSGSPEGNVDDFLLADMSIIYKTTS